MNIEPSEIIKELTAGCQPVANPQLLILMGLPYSGKSTLAGEIGQHNFIHIWATTLKKRYGLQDAAMLDLAETLTRDLLTDGYNVLFDFLNHTFALRERFERVATDLGRDYQVVFVDTKLTEILRRQAATSESIGRSVISPEIIQEIAAELEPPRPTEKFIRVANNDQQPLSDYLAGL